MTLFLSTLGSVQVLRDLSSKAGAVLSLLGVSTILAQANFLPRLANDMPWSLMAFRPGEAHIARSLTVFGGTSL